MSYLCQGCGRALEHDGIRVKVVCTDCGVMTDIRDQGFKRPESCDVKPVNLVSGSSPTRNTPKIEPVERTVDTASDVIPAAVAPSDISLKRVIPETFQSSDQDDGLAYGIGDTGDFYCPGCARVMLSGTVVCVSCGFHVTKGSRLQRKHPVIEKSWNEGFSRSSRVMLSCILCGSIIMLLVMWGELGPGGSRVTLMIGFLAIFQTVLLMGTYGALVLKRNSRGVIKLRRLYWVLFFPVQDAEQTVSGHDGIKLTQSSTGGTIDYILCFILLIPFVFPSLLWYVFQIHRSVFEVALTRDRGRMVRRVFMSREEDKALEIARMLKELSGLPLNDA